MSFIDNAIRNYHSGTEDPVIVPTSIPEMRMTAPPPSSEIEGESSVEATPEYKEYEEELEPEDMGGLSCPGVSLPFAKLSVVLFVKNWHNNKYRGDNS